MSMKIVQINHVCGKGSTGKICVGISRVLTNNDVENYIIYFSGHSDYPYSKKISRKWYIKFQAFKSHLFGNYGFNSAFATHKVIKLLRQIKPDIVHIHNVHGHDINICSLFYFLSKTNIKIVYTFHDCWSFTGYCPHFLMTGCKKWQSVCEKCPQFRDYSWIFDRSRSNYLKKRNAFNSVKMTIVTPSKWLSKVVKSSFLNSFPILVINNGIDLTIFKPRASSFRQKNHLEKQFVLLGVADNWGIRKGVDVFVELSKRLPNYFSIVLVGTSHSTDKFLPKNILSIHKTNNQKELAEIYSSADLFVNPTREDNYPTVNMEAIACGTPVITFNVGGSSEMIDDKCGVLVDLDDVDSLEKEILNIYRLHTIDRDYCVNKSKEFDMNNRFADYYELYKSL